MEMVSTKIKYLKEILTKVETITLLWCQIDGAAFGNMFSAYENMKRLNVIERDFDNSTVVCVKIPKT